jgi:hypothetical protein
MTFASDTVSIWTSLSWSWTIGRSCGISHTRACALGRRNSLGNRSPDIDGDGQNLDAGGIRIARSLDNFSAYKPKPTPTHTN